MTLLTLLNPGAPGAPPATASDVSSTTTIGAIKTRIDVIAAELRATRFNEVGEQADALETLSREISDAVLSRPDQAIDKAWRIVASLFDVLGSRPGAKLMIAGIAAVLIGGTGWPAVAALSVSWAALEGKETFLKVLAQLGLGKQS